MVLLSRETGTGAAAEPNAKKYSDAKKELLRIRDDVEQDLHDLKEKAQVSLNNFAVSEKALQEANIGHAPAHQTLWGRQG